MSPQPPKQETITVLPSDRIFKELGNNSYNFVDVISELIDNSISAKHENLLRVMIEIGLSSKNENCYFKITDNASGIALENLAKALSPAANSGGKTLNEHGLGLKQAIASLGDLEYIISKERSMQHAVRIKELRFGEIPIEHIDVEWNCGTEICIKNLANIVEKNTKKYDQNIVGSLGARYRRYLRQENPQMSLQISLYDIDGLMPNIIKQWDIEEVNPIYFHPQTRKNKPYIEKKEFRGRGWSAEFTFGYAPLDHEYEELGLSQVSKSHPYYVSLNKQGIDIFKNDRVIKFHQLSELGLTPVKHNSYNHIRGELHLQKGFTTSITKNHVIYDQHFTDLLNQLKDFMLEKNLIHQKYVQNKMPEKLLRDRLIQVMKNNQFFHRTGIHKEYVIEGLDGHIDIYTDTDAWELKINAATGYDVYQLFAYMDMGNITEGFLVAPEFKPSAMATVSHINKKHGVLIQLMKLSDLPINYPPTNEEMEIYY